MENDEDEFEYDDDFEYDVGSNSDDDENVRQEIELDDIKDRLRHDSQEAKSQLKKLASCYTSSVCVNAALQLFGLEITPESFTALMHTIANAPNSVEDHARCSAFEDATRLLKQSSQLSDQTLTELYVMAASLLRTKPPSRVYLRAVLKVAEIYLSNDLLESAWSVLNSDFDPAVASINELAAPPFRFESLILKIRLCAAATPVRRTELCSLVGLASQMHRGAHSVGGMSVLQQVHGLLKIEAGMPTDAKMLLTESFKGQFESEAMAQDQSTCVSSAYMLILVSTVVGEGHFDPLLEIPLIGSIADESVLRLPFEIAAAFRERDSNTLIDLLQRLEQIFSEEHWRLGQRDILHALRTSFAALQFAHALQPYSRIRWGTLVSVVGLQLDVTLSDFWSLVLDNGLPGVFKSNEVDDTIDRLTGHTQDWRSASAISAISTPLPKRYQEFAQREAQKKREDKILSKWRRESQPSQIRSGDASKAVIGNAVHSMLLEALRNHTESMSHVVG